MSVALSLSNDLCAENAEGIGAAPITIACIPSCANIIIYGY